MSSCQARTWAAGGTTARPTPILPAKADVEGHAGRGLEVVLDEHTDSILELGPGLERRASRRGRDRLAGDPVQEEVREREPGGAPVEAVGAEDAAVREVELVHVVV